VSAACKCPAVAGIVFTQTAQPGEITHHHGQSIALLLRRAPAALPAAIYVPPPEILILIRPRQNRRWRAFGANRRRGRERTFDEAEAGAHRAPPTSAGLPLNFAPFRSHRNLVVGVRSYALENYYPRRIGFDTVV